MVRPKTKVKMKHFSQHFLQYFTYNGISSTICFIVLWQTSAYFQKNYCRTGGGKSTLLSQLYRHAFAEARPEQQHGRGLEEQARAQGRRRR
jgi:hypothetical protein